MNIKKVLKYAFVFLAIILGLIIFLTLMKALFVYGLYSFFLEKIYTTFGMDVMLARVIAVFAAVITLLALPWIISFLLFGRRKKEMFLLASAVTAVCFLGLYYGTANVFFDRTTGQPIKYYIKTLEGFKFSSKGDYDPVIGDRFKAITPEIYKEYYLWQKTGKLENIPEVRAGKYFDMLTGEPIVWYSERPDGKIKLFPLPGFDPMTQKRLKPMAPDVIPKIIRMKQTMFDYNELDYDQTKIINLIKQGKIDLDWYFETKENAFELESEIQSRGSTGFLGWSDWVHEFNLFAEKIIFLPPSYTIVGICFKGVRSRERVNIAGGHILDSRGTKYQPIWHIGAIRENDGIYISLNRGEIKRVFLVLEYISPEKFETGAYTGKGDVYIKFSPKSMLAKKGKEKNFP